MDAIRQRVVRARDTHQLRKLALERLIAIAQHFHLPLDQAHRCAGVAQMRQAELREQGTVALEKIRIRLEILGDAAVVDGVLFDAPCLTCHCSKLPVMSR
jgi:hypothetical protein